MLGKQESTLRVVESRVNKGVFNATVVTLVTINERKYEGRLYDAKRIVGGNKGHSEAQA